VPSPDELLRRYAERHNAGVESGNFDLLTDLFDADAVMAFVGFGSMGTLRGREEILEAFAKRPPTDALRLDAVSERDGEAVARYTWCGHPGSGGRLTLVARGGRIVRLVVERSAQAEAKGVRREHDDR